MISVMQRKPITASKDECNAKEGDTGKSIKNTLHVLWYARGIPQPKVMLNSEKKIKSVA